MIALKKKTEATKCSDNRTISLIAHTAKIVEKLLRRRIERKIEDVLGEDEFGDILYTLYIYIYIRSVYISEDSILQLSCDIKLLLQIYSFVTIYIYIYIYI